MQRLASMLLDFFSIQCSVPRRMGTRLPAQVRRGSRHQTASCPERLPPPQTSAPAPPSRRLILGHLGLPAHQPRHAGGRCRGRSLGCTQIVVAGLPTNHTLRGRCRNLNGFLGRPLVRILVSCFYIPCSIQPCRAAQHHGGSGLGLGGLAPPCPSPHSSRDTGARSSANYHRLVQPL